MRNVQSWQNQPSVISSVEYELVEVRILKEKISILNKEIKDRT